MNNFEIINYSEKYLENIISLFDKVYGKKLTKQYWEWRFTKNPFGKPLIKLCVKDDTVIAMYLTHPVFVNMNSEIHKMLFSMFTMTDPKYSGQGIMTKLFGQTITDAIKQEYSGIFGFANQNSRYMFTKKLSFSEIVQMKELSINIQDTNNFLKNDSCKQISKFDEKFTKFFKEHKPINKYTIERTADYLNWRFFENPEINYTVYEITNDKEIHGYFVLKNYENKKGHIVDFILMNDSLSQMISKSIDFCKQNNLSQLTLWANPKSELYRMCKKNNFYSQSMPTFFIVNATTSLKPDISNYKNWYVTMSDSDVF